MKNIKLLVNLCWLTILTGGISFKTFAQCELPNIVISADVTLENENLEMTEDQQIIVTNGATLTMRGCVVTQKTGCSGNWDGIYLITTELGEKAGLVLEEGTKVLFSKNGIQALKGWKTITLRNAVMSDNGQMIDARDPWPFGPISQGLRLGGSEASAEYIPCEYFTPPSKVTISEQSFLAVTQVGISPGDPPKKIRQISVLGGELTVANSDIINGQSDWLVSGINSSIGKCRIYGSTIDGFWIGVYKGSDASAHCISEGLLLTGSQIVNTWIIDNFNAPGFAVYNISSNAFIKGNVLEANVHSSGISYSAMLNNNIYYEENILMPNASVYIDAPEESFSIKNNKLVETTLEFVNNNTKTDVTCNKWVNERYAVVAGGQNEFPVSWGTASKTAGNLWDEEQSAMYNFSPLDEEINYYYRTNVPNEIFDWQDGFSEIPTIGSNSECTYTWPSNFTEIDTIEYFLLIEDLEDAYNQVVDSIAYIESNSDTSEIQVQEIIAELNRRLSDLVGMGMLFHTSTDSQYWNEKLNVKVLELLALNYLWYGQDMQSIYDHLISKSDPDAQVLLDATKIVSNAIDQHEDFYALPGLQVDSLEMLAESSFGNYSNLLRNYLYMVYDIFVPWSRESILDSLRSESYAIQPLENNFIIDQPGFTVFPNPFTDNIGIHTGIEGDDFMCSVQVYNLQGSLIYSAHTACNGGQINAGDLKPGMYMLQIDESTTGKRMTKRIFKIDK